MWNVEVHGNERTYAVRAVWSTNVGAVHNQNPEFAGSERTVARVQASDITTDGENRGKEK